MEHVKGDSLRAAWFLSIMGTLIAGCTDGHSRAEASAGLEVAVEQDLRIDGYDQDLVPIAWLGVSPSGRIALIQIQDRAVRFFDSAGVPVGSVGRDGEGPGEFRLPRQGGWVGDTLWVSDVRLGRVTLIAPDLSVVRMATRPSVLTSLPESQAEGLSYAGDLSPYAMYSDGTVLFYASPNDPGAEGELPHLVRASESGGVLRDVATVPNMDERNVLLEVERGGFVINQVPFFPNPDWAVAPDGGFIGLMSVESSQDSSSVRLRLVSSDAVDVFDRTYRFNGVPIPTSVMDSAIAAQVKRREPAHRLPMERRLRTRAPSVFPSADGLVIGSDGRSWIGLLPTHLGKPWMAVDSAGEPSVVATLPSGARLWAATATHLYATARDSLGVESVLRFRFAEGGGRGR